MKILELIRRSVASHRIAAGAFLVVLIALVAIAIAIPLVRNAESERFERACAQSSQLLVEALGNPAIFTGDPDTALAELQAKVDALSRLHDAVVLGNTYFAKSAAFAALDYTEYTAHVGAKLLQVEQAQVHARTAYETYDKDVQILKASNLAGRPQAQDDVNSMTSEARAATELAFQECVLLDSLTRNLSAARLRAQKVLKEVGPELDPAVAALQPRLHDVLEASHVRRKVFNPAARAPA